MVDLTSVQLAYPLPSAYNGAYFNNNVEVILCDKFISLNRIAEDMPQRIFGAMLRFGGKFIEAYHGDLYHDARKLAELLTVENITAHLDGHTKRFLCFWAARNCGSEFYAPGHTSREWWEASKEYHTKSADWHELSIEIKRSERYADELVLTISSPGTWYKCEE